MKIFTLDAELILRKAGRPSDIDRASTKQAINALFQSGWTTQSTKFDDARPDAKPRLKRYLLSRLSPSCDIQNQINHYDSE